VTAEVGVLNRLGVALAADSAASIGQDADKIWASADKLFHLARRAPVGIMIYGNASFVGIPWETVVKDFRRTLGDTRYDKLERYAKRFFSFLASNRFLTPIRAQDRAVTALIETLLVHVREEMKTRLTKEAEKRNGLAENEIGPIVAEVARLRLARIRKQEPLAGFGPTVRRALRKRYTTAVRRIRMKTYGKLPMSAGTSRTITSMAFEMLARWYFGPAWSGVVVAGFGERESMPSIFAYQIEEMAAGVPRRTRGNQTRITQDTTAVIVPFAQQEMVHSFLRGVDPDLTAHMRGSTSVLFDGTITKILDATSAGNPTLRQSLESTFRPEVQRLLTKLFGDWDARTDRHWIPVINMVASLPKDELAAMAEALVNLTKFRRRITPERETVGGPIDVAVITKGDGFIWVKRKHYFDASLNPRVIGRYKREG
jgi:hypothetical protein